MVTSFPKPVLVKMTAKLLCGQIGGCLSLIGNSETVISSVASPKNADHGSLVFCNKKNKNEIDIAIKESKASVLIVAFAVPVEKDCCLIVADDPLGWFIKALHLLLDLQVRGSIHNNSFVGKTAFLGEDVSLGAGTFIGENCVIGNQCKIGSNCTIEQGTVLGHNVVIQNNCSIGGVGLGYHFTPTNERLFFPHLGVVRIGNNVVVGSNTVIVRGELEDTIVEKECRIGNLVNIGHNVSVGCSTVISSSTCIAGGTVIGHECNIAAGVTINAKIRIGNACQVGLGSVVVRNVPDRTSVFGNPARPLPTMKKF